MYLRSEVEIVDGVAVFGDNSVAHVVVIVVVIIRFHIPVQRGESLGATQEAQGQQHTLRAHSLRLVCECFSTPISGHFVEGIFVVQSRDEQMTGGRK